MANEHLLRYAMAAGACRSAWRLADSGVRESVAIALISKAWDVLVRDAGRGEVGPAHERQVGSDALLAASDDARRDAFLILLSERGAPLLKRAAAQLVQATEARRGFSADHIAMVEIGTDALAGVNERLGPVGTAFSERADGSLPLFKIACAVDQLRLDPNFSESMGSEVRHSLPRGTYTHYVQATPGAAWAFNVAMLLKGSPHADLPAAGLACRAVFRPDMDGDDVCEQLIAQAAYAVSSVESLFKQTLAEIARGRSALSHLSRNARAFDAWKIIVAVQTVSRSQLARMLRLSRAGADIQARVLAEAGLVELGHNGRISWRRTRARHDVNVRPLTGNLRAVAAEVDANLAEIDRLLARSR